MSGTEAPRKSWLHPAMEVRASPIEGHGLIATAEIRAGDTVALLGGRIVSGHQLRQLLARANSQDPPTYVDAITVAADAHLVLPEGETIHFLNHSCDPNCGLLIDRTKEVLQLQALRSVREGAEVSIDYDTFEYEIEFMPEQCLCGSQHCRGRVRGFKHLPVSVANQLVKRHEHYVADYLRLEFAGRALQAASPL